MIDYEEATTILCDQHTEQRSTRIPIAEAGGRIAAEAVQLNRDQPGFDRATMDGYAVHLQDTRATYHVIGTIHAGDNSSLKPGVGEAVRIMTGAPCPPDVAVVPIEDTDGGTSEVVLNEPARWQVGMNIAQRGEDGCSGDTVITAGTLLSPAVLSAAAMAGATDIKVFEAPRIGLCTTGNEVGGDGDAGIADSNGPFLLSLLAHYGLPVIRRHAQDTEADLQNALAELDAQCDIIVTTGGVSAGSKDLVPGALANLGYETLFHGVAIQPGKPVLCGRHPAGRFCLGLPGNPVSVLATAHLFLLPLIGRFCRSWEPAWVHLPLTHDFQHRKKRRLFLPARLVDGGIEAMAWHGSGDLLAAAAADGLIDLRPGSTYTAGDLLAFLPYAGSQLTRGAQLPAGRR